jgi:glycine betaine/proline transport system permease protein
MEATYTKTQIKKIPRKSLVRYLTLIAIIAAFILATILLQDANLNTPKLSVGRGVEIGVDWAVIYLSPALETIKIGITKVLVLLENFLLWVPWPVWVVFIGLLSWRLISWGVGLLAVAGLLLIQLMQLWGQAMSSLALVGTAVLLSIIIGVPLGIIAARSNRFESIVRPVLDAMQTIPSMVYLIPVVMLLGVGKVPAVAATMIFGIPPTIRLTNLGLRQVSTDVKEAARSFGASSLQTLIKVEMPLAIRTVMAGVNQSTMMSVSMVVIAAFIGAGGLGYSVLFALDRVRIGSGSEAGLAILIIAIILDRLTQALGRTKQRQTSNQ